MLIIDSREKKWEHIKEYLERNNIPYEVKKLDVGDYFNTEQPGIVIDRKANLQEVCTNLQRGKENISRFTKECKRAYEQKIEFVVLIEGSNCEKVSDVKDWKSKYSDHTGQWLYKEMFRLYLAYKVKWMFCKKNQTAKELIKLLKVGGKDGG